MPQPGWEPALHITFKRGTAAGDGNGLSWPGLSSFQRSKHPPIAMADFIQGSCWTARSGFTTCHLRDTLLCWANENRKQLAFVGSLTNKFNTSATNNHHSGSSLANHQKPGTRRSVVNDSCLRICHRTRSEYYRNRNPLSHLPPFIRARSRSSPTNTCGGSFRYLS